MGTSSIATDKAVREIERKKDDNTAACFLYIDDLDLLLLLLGTVLEGKA